MTRFASYLLLLGTCVAFLPPSSFHRRSRLSSTVVKEPTIVDTDSTAATSVVPPPGQAEDALFDCDGSVAFWKNFQRSGLASDAENLREIAAVGSRFASYEGGLDYWTRHVARSGYFATNAALGVAASTLHDRFLRNDSTAKQFVQGVSAGITRLLLESALAYEQDFLRIREGLYKKPYDMFESTRQSSPLFVATQTARFVREAVGTLTRRKRGAESDKKIWIDSDMYPDYYRTAFHYQTDGWMSKESADVYETSTETLFVGRQDAMQRTALPEIVQLARKQQSNDQPLRILEVACGTGRFLTFLRDNLPTDAQVTGVDLSPFYLEAARENDREWRKLRGGNPSPSTLVQARAEELPFDDESFDAVVCVYLFHELPRDVRGQVAREMARVVRPGGTVVLTDSIQLGDRPVLDAAIGNFQNMNEPFYRDYIADDLPSHFAGLECGSKMQCASTKTLTFRK